MSLILEALKKSEAKRRLGEAPDLGTPFAARRERPNLLPILAVTILLAGGAGWWLMRAPTPASAPPAATVAASKAPMRALAPTRVAPMHSPVSGQPAQAGSVRTNPRSPAKLASNATSQLVPGPDNAVTNRFRPQPLSPAAAAAPAAPQVSAAQAPAPVHKPVILMPPAAGAATAAVTTANKPATPIATPVRAPTAAFPDGTKAYAELPFSVRKALPAINLSMHVYATDPAQRFVILNDSRLSEGDKTSDDVTVREIRPDGVVLEFQGQRFFYPRDGF